MDERLVVRGGVEKRGHLRREGLEVVTGGDAPRAGREEVGHAGVRLFGGFGGMFVYVGKVDGSGP